MKVMVTGHLGYIGTVLSPMLLKEGFEVVGVDSDLFGRCTYGDKLVSPPGINKDIRDLDASDFEGIDAVIHLAALSNNPRGDLDPTLIYKLNHRASVHVAKMAKKAGVKRFLFSSSCCSYATGGEDLATEESPVNPATPYAESKLLVERDLKVLASDNFSPTIMRVASAYGASPRLRFEMVLNNLVAWAYSTGRVYLKSEGCASRPLIHIEDVARAFVAALRTPREKIHNQIFNIGLTAENYRIDEIAAIVEEMVPGAVIHHADDLKPDPVSYRVDGRKANLMLYGFRPRWTVKDGVNELLDTFRKHDLKLEDFEGAKFQRLAHIKHLRASAILTPDLRFNSLRSRLSA